MPSSYLAASVDSSSSSGSPLGARKEVAAGQAAYRYSLTAPPRMRVRGDPRPSSSCTVMGWQSASGKESRICTGRVLEGAPVPVMGRVPEPAVRPRAGRKGDRGRSSLQRSRAEDVPPRSSSGQGLWRLSGISAPTGATRSRESCGVCSACQGDSRAPVVGDGGRSWEGPEGPGNSGRRLISWESV
jgi:hypothetical protein